MKFLEVILFYSAFIYQASAFEPFIDTQQCHALHTSQFEYLLKDFVSEVPTVLLQDKQAFTSFITELYSQKEYGNTVLLNSSVPFSPGGYDNQTTFALFELQSLITQYFLTPTLESLTKIAVYTIISPGYPIPQQISNLIIENGVLFTETALLEMISLYSETRSPLLLPYISQLMQVYPSIEIPEYLITELVTMGYIVIPTEETLLALIQQAITSSERELLVQIAQLAGVFPNVHIPASIVRALIENTLFTRLQGESYYRRLLAEATVSYTMYTLQQIVEFSIMFPNIVIQETIVQALIRYGLISKATGSSVAFGNAFATEETLIELIRQALTSSSYTLLQQIAHLSLRFRRVPIPAVIMRELIINSLVETTRGEKLLTSLIQSALIEIKIETLIDISLLYDLFPNIELPQSIIIALIQNGLIPGIIYSETISETTLVQLIEEVTTTTTTTSSILLLKYQQIMELIPLFPYVSIPNSIKEQLQLLRLARLYIASPTLELLKSLSQLLTTYPNFPLPSTLVNEILVLSKQASSLSTIESSLQSLVIQSFQVRSESSLVEIVQLLGSSPQYPVPNSVALSLAGSFTSAENLNAFLTSLAEKLVQEYTLTQWEEVLYQLAELYARWPTIEISSTVVVSVTSIINRSALSSQEIVVRLIQLINTYYLTRSTTVLNEIFILIEQVPGFPIPEFIELQYLIQRFLSTSTSEVLPRIAILILKYQETVVPEIVIEALITQTIWASRAVNTQIILSYLITNYPTTTSYTILQFIMNLFWIHPETVLPLTTIEQLIRYGLLVITSQETLSVETIQSYQIQLPKLIRSYAASRSTIVLEQIIKIVQIITSYPLPQYIWIEYYVLMYERTASKFYLEQIGRRLYKSWKTVLSEKILEELLQQNLLLGYIESETELLQYLISNYSKTSSPYILAALYQLYIKYPEIQVSSEIVTTFIRLGLVKNQETAIALQNIESIMSELQSISVQDTTQQASLFGILPWRQATSEKLVLMNEKRLTEVQALVKELLNRTVDTALPTQQTIGNLLNGIVSTLTYFLKEAQIRTTTNNKILSKAHLQRPEAVQITVANFADNIQIAFGALGRAAGTTEAIISAVGAGNFNIAALGEIIRQLLLLESPLDSIESIFDDLLPLVTLNEGTRTTVLESILPSRLEAVETSVIINQQRFSDLTLLVQETILKNDSNTRIAQLLNSIMTLISSFIREADLRMTENRNILIRVITTTFSISTSDLEIFSNNLKTAETSLGRAAGAIESVVLALTSGDITVTRIAIILKEILQFDQSTTVVETLYDEYLSMPLLTIAAKQTTLATLLPWRLAVAERHVSVVQNRLQDLAVLVNSIVETASESSLSRILSATLNYITSLANEAAARTATNKNILEYIVSKNFDVESQKLTPFDENDKIIQFNLGRVNGATEALVLAFLTGELSVAQLQTIIEIALRADQQSSITNALYYDLDVLSSLAVTSNLKTTLLTILRNISGESTEIALSGSVGDAAKLLSVIGTTSEVTSVDDVVALQTILAVILPARQALLDKYVTIAIQRLEQIKILANAIIEKSVASGAKYNYLGALMNDLLDLTSTMTSVAQQKANENRQIVVAAAQKQFLISGTELQPFIENVQIAASALGRAMGITNAMTFAYNGGQFSVDSISLIIKYLVEADATSVTIESIINGQDIAQLDETNRLSVLSVLLPWKLAALEKFILNSQSRVSQVSILAGDVTQATSLDSVRLLTSSLASLLSSLVNEAQARLLANKNILQWLTNGAINSNSDLSAFNANGQIITYSLGKVEGAIEAFISAYVTGEISAPNFNLILSSFLSFDTTYTSIESLYNELSVLSSVNVGYNLQKTLSAILQSITGSSSIVSTTTERTSSAVALWSIIGTIESNLQTSVSGEISTIEDVVALQTIMAVTMTSLQSSLEKNVIISKIRLQKFLSLTADVASRAAEVGSESNAVVSLIEILSSTVSVLVESASVAATENRNIINTAISKSFLVSGSETRRFTENSREASLNLGKAEGLMEAFIIAYNNGQFGISSMRLILESLTQYDSSVTSTEILYQDSLSILQSSDVGRQIVLSVIWPWRLAVAHVQSQLYQNRLSELNVLTKAIEASTSSTVLASLAGSIYALGNSLVSQAVSRQFANQKIYDYATSRQFAISKQDIASFNENQAVIYSSLGKLEGAINSLSEAYNNGSFDVQAIGVIIESLIGIDLSLVNIETLYQDLELLTSLSVGYNLRIPLQTILKNYLGENYVDYKSTISEASGLASLLSSFSISLQSGSYDRSITSANDVVALQTILAVVLPARQALVDKYVSLTLKRLQDINILINDFKLKAIETGSSYQVLVNLVSQVSSNLYYLMAEAQVRANENREFVNSAALKSFVISTSELTPFVANTRVIGQLLGKTAGAIESIVLAYNNNQLNVENVNTVISSLMSNELTVISIESIYEELSAIALTRISVRPTILSKILPWRQASIEKHIQINSNRISELKVLIEDIITQTANSTFKVLLESLLSLINSWTQEAESRSVAISNIVNTIASQNYEATDSQLNSIFENLRVISQSFGKAVGTSEAIALSYNRGELSINSVSSIIETFVTSQSTSAVEVFYDELQSLASQAVGTNLQSTLSTVLSSFSDTQTNVLFGSSADVQALRSLLGNFQVAFSQTYDTTIITSSDAVALQTILAVVFPAQLSTIEKLYLIHERRLEETRVLVESYIVNLSKSEIPSVQSITSLLRGILSMIGYFTSEAQLRVVENRKILNYAINKKFLITYEEAKTFFEDSKFAYNALGRAAGGTEALVKAIESGAFDIATLHEIIQVILSFDETMTLIDFIFSDLQPLLSENGLDMRNIFEIILPSRQAILEAQISTFTERLLEFEALILSVAESELISDSKGYRSLKSALEAILIAVQGNIIEATSLTSQNRKIVTSAASRSFQISIEEVTVFSRNSVKIESLLGKSEGAISSVVEAYNSGHFSLSSVSVIIAMILEADLTTSRIEELYTSLQTLFTQSSTTQITRQTILATILPWRIAQTEKMLVINSQRLQSLKTLIDSISSQHSTNSVVLSTVQAIYLLASSLTTEISARFLANKNVYNFIEGNNFIIELEELTTFNQNEAVIWSYLSRIAGATEALVISYNAKELSVQSLQSIIETFLLIDTSISMVENLYEQLTLLTTIPVGANLAETLRLLIEKYLGTNTYVGTVGGLNEAAGLRAFVESLTQSLQTTTTTTTAVSEVNDVVALQTVLAVILPGRQAALEQQLVIANMRYLQQLQLLIEDYARQSLDTSAEVKPIVNILNYGLTSIRYYIDQATIRINENRAFVTASAKKQYLVFLAEIQPFINNGKAASVTLGRIAGTVTAIADAYNSGELTFATVSDIIRDLLILDRTILRIEDVYFEILNVNNADIAYRQKLFAHIIPWRMATIEKHLEVSMSRVADITNLINGIITESSHAQIQLLLSSVQSYVSLLVDEANSLYLAIKNSVKSFEKQNWDISEDNVKSVFKSVNKIGDNLGRASAAIDEVVIAFNNGEFDENRVQLILNSLISTQTSSSSIEILFDELEMLTSMTVGSNLQHTLRNLLSNLKQKPESLNFGTANDALALRSVLGSINTALSTTYSQSTVSSVSDVVALQTALAVMLPAQQAALEKFIIVHQQRLEEVKILLEGIIQQMVESDMPSKTSITTLLHGIISIITYFTKEAQIRATANRQALDTAINRNFLITSQELSPYIENSVVAFSALGKAAGAIEAVVTAVNSGSLSVNVVRLIVKTLFQFNQSELDIDVILGDIQALLSTEGIDQRNILEIILPAQQESLELSIVKSQERLVELTILVNDIVSHTENTSTTTYLKLSSLVKAILSLVTSQVTEASLLSSRTSSIVTTAAGNSFVVSTQDLKLFTESIQKAYSLIGRSEGAITSLVEAYNAGLFSVDTVTSSILSIFNLDESISSVETIISSLETLYSLDLQSRQTILSVVLPWQLALVQKLVLINEGRQRELNTLAESIVVNTEQASIKTLIQATMTLISTLLTQASSGLIANENYLAYITGKNFDVNSAELNAFIENQKSIMALLGRVAGSTEALVVSYVAGQLSSESISVIVQTCLLIDQSTTQLESLYDNLKALATLPVGSNLARTLQAAITSYLEAIDTNTSNTFTTSNSLLQTVANELDSAETTTITETIVLQTIFAVILPARQAVIDKYMLIFEQKIQEFAVLNSNILLALETTGSAQEVLVTALKRISSNISYLYSEAAVRASENRQFVASAAKRRYLISPAETYAFFSNEEVVEKSLGKIAGMIEVVSSAYNAGQFALGAASTTILELVSSDQTISSIESIYGELSDIKNFDYAVRQKILAYLLPWRQATLEKHIIINQQRVRELTVLIESIINTSSLTSIRQIVHNILSLVVSLTNEANARSFANQNLLSSFAVNNYVVSDTELNVLTDNVRVAGAALGRAAAIIDVLVKAYIRGDFSVQNINVIISSIMEVEDSTEKIELLYDTLQPLLSLSSELQQTLSIILQKLGYPIVSSTLEEALSLQAASLNTAPLPANVPTSSVQSIDEVVALQITLATVLPSIQSILDEKIVQMSQRIQEAKIVIDTLTEEYFIGADSGQRQLISVLREVYSLIIYLFKESQIRASSSRNDVTIAGSRNFVILTTELQNFIEDVRIAFTALGKTSGAIDALLSAREISDVTATILSEIVTQLKSTFAVQSFVKEFSEAIITISETTRLESLYLESPSFSILKQISQIIASKSNVVVSDVIMKELARLGLLPGSIITEEIILLQLIEEFVETQSNELLNRLVSLLKSYPNVKVPYVVVKALVSQTIVIQSEEYYKLVIGLYSEYPNEAFTIIIQLISVYPNVSLTLPILERLVREDYISVTVLDQLIVIWQETKSPVALRLILEIFSRFPTYSLPLAILDMIYEQSSSTTSSTEITSDITRSITSEDLLAQLIIEFQQYPSETLLLEIDELYRERPNYILPVSIAEQITLLRLVQEAIMLPAPSVAILQKLGILSQQYPIVTIPINLREQILLVIWIQNLTPSFEVLRKISEVYTLYPHIPIPFPIQEQLLLLQLIESQPLTLNTIERILILSASYPHLPLSVTITDQINFLRLLKISSPSFEEMSQLMVLSAKYPSIPLSEKHLQQIQLVKLVSEERPSATVIVKIWQLSQAYPNIKLPSRIKDILNLYSLIEETVVTKYATETVIKTIETLSQTYNFVSKPQTVKDISLLYKLIAEAIASTSTTSTSTTLSSTTSISTTSTSKTSPNSALVELLKNIYKLSKQYPRIPIPLAIVRLILQTIKSSTFESSSSTTITTIEFAQSTTAEEQMAELTRLALKKPSYSLIKQIMALRAQVPNYNIPIIIQQQITLVELVETVKLSAAPSVADLENINSLYLSFPHIPIPSSILEQIALIQIIAEVSRSQSPSIVLLRQIINLSPSYPGIPVPIRIQEMLILIQLIDQVISYPSPSTYIVEEIASRSTSYPFIPIPARLQGQIALQRLIVQVMQTSTPSSELLLEINNLSLLYPHVVLPNILQEQITLLLLIQEASESSAPAYQVLKQISNISPLYPHINVPTELLQQISFIKLIESALQTRAPSFAVLEEIITLSKKYPHIPVPVSLLQQYYLYQKIEELLKLSSPSYEILIQINQIAQLYPYLSIPESLSLQLVLYQLILELRASPSIVILEEISSLSASLPNFILESDIQEQINLLKLVQEVSQNSAPSVASLEQISSGSKSYTYITIPAHVQEQINLLEMIKTASSNNSELYRLLPSIIEYSGYFPHIPIPQNIQVLTTLYQLIQQVLVTPSPLSATILEIARLHKQYPDYPIPASILELIQKLTSSASLEVTTSTTTTSVTSLTTKSSEQVANGQIILRQLIALALQGSPTKGLLEQIALLSPIYPEVPIPTAIQQQITLLRLIEQALSSISPTPHLLHQISVLSSTYPHIPIPDIILKQIRLLQLIQDITVEATLSMEILEEISVLHQMFPYLPIPAHIQQQLILILLIEEVNRSPVPSVSIIRQIAQISPKFPNVIIPQNILEQIQLLQLISEITSNVVVSVPLVQQITPLVKKYPYIPIPTPVSEIITLISLLQQQPLTYSVVEQITILSQAHANVILSSDVRNQIRLVQLIKEVTSSSSPSLVLISELAELSEKYPNIELPLAIQELIQLLKLIQQVSSTLTADSTTILKISELSVTNTNIPIPDYISNYIEMLSLLSNLTPSIDVVRQIARIASAYPTIPIPLSILEQIKLVQLIDEFLQSTSPSLTLIQLIQDLSPLYPNILLPESLQEVISLLDLLKGVISGENIELDVIPQIISLSAKYPYIPIPLIVEKRIELDNLIGQALASKSLLPDVLKQIADLSFLLPNVELPSAIADQQEKLKLRALFLELIRQVENSNSVDPDVLAKIEELSQYFPEIPLPPLAQQLIFNHIQETILRQLIAEAQSTPNNHGILQQIEQLQVFLPNFPIPQNVLDQIVVMQKTILLDQLTAEVQSSSIISGDTLHQVLQVSESLPSYQLSSYIQQALSLQSAIEKIEHTAPSSPIDITAVKLIIQLSEAIPNYPIPIPIQNLTKLMVLVEQVQNNSNSSEETILKIDEISSAYPNLALPDSVLQSITKVKNTIKLRELVKQVESSTTVQVQVLRQISQLSAICQGVKLPSSIEQQINLLQLIQQANDGQPSAALLKQLTDLTKLYPQIPLPARVRQLINPKPIPAKVVAPASSASETQLRQYIAMYERVPSLLVLRQIAQILPSVPNPQISEKVKLALVQQGLSPAESS